MPDDSRRVHSRDRWRGRSGPIGLVPAEAVLGQIAAPTNLEPNHVHATPYSVAAAPARAADPMVSTP